jgi:hypothetical protein
VGLTQNSALKLFPAITLRPTKPVELDLQLR